MKHKEQVTEPRSLHQLRDLNGAECLSIKRLFQKGDSNESISTRHDIGIERVIYFRKIHNQGKFLINIK